jgi:hypothetical protein
MEEPNRMEHEVDLHAESELCLPPALRLVGTVNVDETTHAFADKVYDRAQLIELPLSAKSLERTIGDAPYAGTLLQVWNIVVPHTGRH